MASYQKMRYLALTCIPCDPTRDPSSFSELIRASFAKTCSVYMTDMYSVSEKLWATVLSGRRDGVTCHYRDGSSLKIFWSIIYMVEDMTTSWFPRKRWEKEVSPTMLLLEH